MAEESSLAPSAPFPDPPSGEIAHWGLFQRADEKNSSSCFTRCAIGNCPGCRRWESNPHARRHTSLSRARLPVPPLRLVNSSITNPGGRVKTLRDIFFCGSPSGGAAVAVKPGAKEMGSEVAFHITALCFKGLRLGGGASPGFADPGLPSVGGGNFSRFSFSRV